MRLVAGRLKSDYNYSNTIVYNNFVWSNATPEQLARIEACAQAMPDTRAAHPDATLAKTYDPDNCFLFPDLIAAHSALDTAVKAAYGEPDKIRGDKYIYYCDEDKSIGLVFEIENNRVDEIEMGYLG